MSAQILPKIAPITQLSSRIVRFLGLNPSPMTLQGTNSYLIGSGKMRILIDTSSPDKPEYVQNVKDFLISNQCHITDILLTHWHPDHIGSVVEIQSMCSALQSSLPRVYKLDSSHLTMESHRFKHLDEFKVDENAPLSTVVVIETPGHSADHVCFYLKEEKILFSADLILGHGSTTVEDLGPYLNALRKVKKMAVSGEISCILPAHGEIIEEPLEKIEEYIHHREERIRQVLAALSHDAWTTEKDILDKVYPGLDEFLKPAALLNLQQALLYLKSENRALSNENDDELWKSNSPSKL